MPSTLAQRIQAARRYAKLSQAELATRVGVSRPAVSQWENPDPEKGTAPARENLAAISRVTGAPLDWLNDDNADLEPNWLVPQEWEDAGTPVNIETAIVRMPVQPVHSSRHPVSRGRRDEFRAMADSIPQEEAENILLNPDNTLHLVRFALAVQRDYSFIPLYDINVSAGGGRSDATKDILSWYAYRREFLQSMRLDPNECGLVIARGESGEPDVRDGELLLVDFRVNAVRDFGLYVIAIDGEYVVKQAQRNWDGSVTISSANPAYTPSTVPADRLGELTVLGLVRSQQRRR